MHCFFLHFLLQMQIQLLIFLHDSQTAPDHQNSESDDHAKCAVFFRIGADKWLITANCQNTVKLEKPVCS